MASLTTTELRSLLRGFADVLERNQANKDSAGDILELCEMFAGGEGISAATYLKAVQRGNASMDGSGSQLIGSVVPALSSLQNLIKGVARNDVTKSLDLLVDTLRKYADVPIPAFVAGVASASSVKPKTGCKKGVAPVDDRLIEDYVKRLEAALGDDAKFGPLLNEIRSDERITQAAAIAIASQFYGQTAKRTSRLKALELVRERQVKLMKFKQQPSTAGRSAA